MSQLISLVRHVFQLRETCLSLVRYMSHLFQLGETCVSPFSIPGSNTRWGLLRSLNSRTDLPPPRCIKSYYGPCFISTSPCTVFTSFTNVLMFTWILSLHTFYAYLLMVQTQAHLHSTTILGDPGSPKRDVL